MDIKESISEAAAKEGVLLEKNDPLFTGILLNKALLNEYAKELNQAIAESITSVAIKEDVTLAKLRNLIDEKQVNNRKETERILTQFSDNLSGRLHSLLNTINVSNSKPASWVYWLIIAFLIGFLLGGVSLYYFTS